MLVIAETQQSVMMCMAAELPQVQYCIISCYTMLCNALLYQFGPCCAMLCCAGPCYAMLCMPCHATHLTVLAGITPERAETQTAKSMCRQAFDSFSPGLGMERCHDCAGDVVGIRLLPSPHTSHQGRGERPFHLHPTNCVEWHESAHMKTLSLKRSFCGNIHASRVQIGVVRLPCRRLCNRLGGNGLQ